MSVMATGCTVWLSVLIAGLLMRFIYTASDVWMTIAVIRNARPVARYLLTVERFALVSSGSGLVKFHGIAMNRTRLTNRDMMEATSIIVKGPVLSINRYTNIPTVAGMSAAVRVNNPVMTPSGVCIGISCKNEFKK